MSQTPEFAPAHVSVVNEFPEDLYEAMRTFVRTHPNWDQYRLMQVAVAGFLFQQGSRERAVARHYLDGLFDRAGAALPPAEARAAAASPATAPPPMPAPHQRPGPAPGAGGALRPHTPPLPHHPQASPVARRAA